MLEIIRDQVRDIIDIYNDPDIVTALVEQIDYEGKDCFWYLDEYNLYSILDSRIMERVIENKWHGKNDINASILDYSTAYKLYKDKFGLLTSDRLFKELLFEV